MIRTFVSLGTAAWRFFRFWEAKHVELRPQLLAYADVVKLSLPPGQALTFSPRHGTPIRFVDRAALVKEMERLATCRDATCSVQKKGDILKGLDDYFWDERTDVVVRDAAHKARYCMAVRTATQAGEGQKQTEAAIANSAIESRTIPIRLN